MKSRYAAHLTEQELRSLIKVFTGNVSAISDHINIVESSLWLRIRMYKICMKKYRKPLRTLRELEDEWLTSDDYWNN